MNLNGEPISPVVEVLVQRGLPFVFATGYGQRGVPEPYRRTPTLQKPFQADALAQASRPPRRAPRFNSAVILGQSNSAASLVMIRLVGHVEPSGVTAMQ